MGLSDGLPPDWEMSTDPTTGRVFYINHSTMQTSWTPPVEAPLPEGWEQQKDAEGRIFFVNHATQVTQWEDPRLMDESVPTGGQSSVSYPSMGDFSNERFESYGRNHSSSVTSSAASKNEWTCSVCTLANPMSSDTCAACETKNSNINVRPSRNSFDASSAYAYDDNGVGGGGDDTIDAATAAAIAAAQAEEEMFTTSGVSEAYELSPYLVPDEHSSVCMLCNKTFDWKNRRHHCKCCGALLDAECSSRKSRFALPGMKEKEQRVCDLCFDHQSSGDKHCYLRYNSILRDAGAKRESDRQLALKGIADMLDKLPRAFSTQATMEEQSAAMRMLDVVQRCGGVNSLFELVDPNAESVVQVQSSRIISLVAKVAREAELHSEAPLSLTSVCNQLSVGSQGIGAIGAILSRPDAPWEAHSYLAQALYQLGDQVSVQSAARPLMAPLCEMLLAPQEELQAYAVMAVARLVEGNGPNLEALLDANGMHALVLLLSVVGLGVARNAASAICAGLAQETRDARLASRVRDALVQFGGASASLSLLRSDDPQVAHAGLRLVASLSNGQAEVVRAAGAVPLVVALLASRDSACQSGAAELLANVARTFHGRNEVLQSGGLAMAVPLLGSGGDIATQSNAAALCEAFSSDERGAQVIVESGGVPVLVALAKSPDDNVRAPAAGALVGLLNGGSGHVGVNQRQAVVNAGGVEALLALEGSQDPEVLRRLVGAMFSFVSDEQLLASVSRRLQPPTMAMKLLQLLGNHRATLEDSTVEMLLLVVAVLCGAREGDQYDDDGSPPVGVSKQQQQQTRDLVASNGAPLVVPVLWEAASRPALVLAACRLLAAVCQSESAARGVAKASGIPAVARALDDSLRFEGSNDQQLELILQLRLNALRLFGLLCGGLGASTLSETTTDEIKRGVRAITRILDQTSHDGDRRLAVQLAAVRALRSLSQHAGNWQAIAEVALPQLIEMLLAEDKNKHPALLAGVAAVMCNMAKLEKHCDTILDAGAVFALLGLLGEHQADAVEAGLCTLDALCESSRRCRLQVVQEGGAAKLLAVAEQREPKLQVLSLRCLAALALEPANAAKITGEHGATDTLLRLVKGSGGSGNGNSEQSQLALKVLLNVAKDSDTLWEQLVVNADVDAALALLRLGPSPRVQGQACSALAALCGDSPGLSLCSSPAVLEALPLLVGLLQPPEHLGSDKSESPAKEAAAACALIAGSSPARAVLLEAGVVQALVGLLLRERRLNRPRSATSEHTLQALFALSGQEQETGLPISPSSFATSETAEKLWDVIAKLNKRRDTIDALITILDAHIRDPAPTPSGIDRFEVVQNCVDLVGRLPGQLTPAEVTLVGRAARSLNLAMIEAAAPDTLQKACLQALLRLAREKPLLQMLTAAGTIRTLSMLLEPLCSTALANTPNPVVVLCTARLVALLVGGGGPVLGSDAAGEVGAVARDSTIDDAVTGTKLIPALAALVTKTDELFPDRRHSSAALTAGLVAISSLAQGGVSVQRAIMASGSHVLKALAKVADARHDVCQGSGDEEENNEMSTLLGPQLTDQDDQSAKPPVGVTRATHALLTLSRLATLDEHRTLMLDSSEPSILHVCRVILEEDAAKSMDGTPGLAGLITATVQLISDLGPSVVLHMPEIVEPIISNVVGRQEIRRAQAPALEALRWLCTDRKTASSVFSKEAPVMNSLVPKLAALIQGDKEPFSMVNLVMSLLATLAPRVCEDDEAAEKLVALCGAEIARAKATNSAAITHALLAVHSLMLSTRARENVRKNVALLRAIKTIGTSSEYDDFASQIAAYIFASLGTGDRLQKAPKPVSRPPPSEHVAEKQAQQSRPAAPSLHSHSSAGSPPPQAYSSPTLPPTTLPPAQYMASQSPLPPAFSSQPRPSAHPLPPPPASKPPSMLPTYSSVGSSGLRAAPPRGPASAEDRASLELAMKLQAEEKAAVSASAGARRPTPPKPVRSEWNCEVCTLENKGTSTVCEACETPRRAAPTSVQPGIQKVKCPKCKTLLGAPVDALLFNCTVCSTQSPSAPNRVP